MFAEIKLSFVFLCNTGKAGHISTVVWDAKERGPLQCGMQIYENIMQISTVPVFLNKQTNKWQEREWLLCLLEGSWLHLKGCLGVFVYAYGVCVSQCMCAYVYVCVCKGDRGEAMRSECPKEISTSTLFCCVLRPKNALLCQE